MVPCCSMELEKLMLAETGNVDSNADSYSHRNNARNKLQGRDAVEVPCLFENFSQPSRRCVFLHLGCGQMELLEMAHVRYNIRNYLTPAYSRRVATTPQVADRTAGQIHQTFSRHTETSKQVLSVDEYGSK